MTSSAHDASLKGNSFRRTIHSESFIAVAFIFSELDGGASGAPPPPPSRRSKKSPVWIGLKSLHVGRDALKQDSLHLSEDQLMLKFATTPYCTEEKNTFKISLLEKPEG